MDAKREALIKKMTSVLVNDYLTKPFEDPAKQDHAAELIFGWDGSGPGSFGQEYHFGFSVPPGDWHYVQVAAIEMLHDKKAQ